MVGNGDLWFNDDNDDNDNNYTDDDNNNNNNGNNNNVKKNPAYGRHQLSRPMRIIGPIQI